MKALLICPEPGPAVAALAKYAPLAALPALGETVIEYWLVHLAGLGARRITILVPDRADAVLDIVGSGARWGVQVNVLTASSELSVVEARTRYRDADESSEWLPEPDDVTLMDHLPGMPERKIFESYAKWFLAVQAWMPHAQTPDRISGYEIQPGIHIGLNCHIPTGTVLIPPCWIGEKVFLGAGVTVGPMAVVENRAKIEQGSEIVRSIVGPETLVGRFTEIRDSLAMGETLINWRTGSCLKVHDAFLLGPLRGEAPVAPRSGWKLADLWPVNEHSHARRAETAPKSLNEGILIQR